MGQSWEITKTGDQAAVGPCGAENCGIMYPMSFSGQWNGGMRWNGARVACLPGQFNKGMTPRLTPMEMESWTVKMLPRVR